VAILGLYSCLSGRSDRAGALPGSAAGAAPASGPFRPRCADARPHVDRAGSHESSTAWSGHGQNEPPAGALRLRDGRGAVVLSPAPIPSAVDLADDTPDTGNRVGDGHSVLVVRRHRFTGELSFYRCHSAAPVTFPDLVHVICTRWRVEEDFQLAKGATGLDQGQVTCWNSWMRWSLLSLLTAAVLAVTHARTTPTTGTSDLVPVSTRELLNLLRTTVLPLPSRDTDHALHWSAWRRRHQAVAQACHQRWNNITATVAT
jgi:hypothetical protein